jgi:serine/threonine protein phosphatase 1
MTARGRTFAIGDLHGEAQLLRDLVTVIAPQPHDTLILLGDYLDRGPDALGTIETLEALVRRCRCVCLLGNHDEEWLDLWDGERFTHCPAVPGARRVWDQHQGQVPPVIGQFLTKAQRTYEDGYAWYAHAGARPGVPFWETPPEVYVWGDPDFLTSPYDWGKPVVFGHWELETPLITHTKIGLDTAAWRTGVLTAMQMETGQIVQVQRKTPAHDASARDI